MPYFDCQRKFETYRAMDSYLQTVPIVAYPILSDESGQAAIDRTAAAQTVLFELTGIETKPIERPETTEADRAIMDDLVGGGLIDITDIIKDMHNG